MASETSTTESQAVTSISAMKREYEQNLQAYAKAHHMSDEEVFQIAGMAH